MNTYNFIKEVGFSFLDIFLVTLIIYFCFKVITKSKKHAMVIIGIMVFIIFYTLANILKLNTLSSILNNIYSWGFVIIIILFQTEIKNALEKIGDFTSILNTKSEDFNFIDELTEACYEMGSKNVGALITIERSFPLDNFTKNAIKIDSNFSKYMLYTIFNKEAPIHDGAVIIKDERIAFASTYFPIALDINLGKNFGTRHRAGLTISKETDSITIIISEETGGVSIAFENRLYKNLDEEFFKDLLIEKINRSKK